MGAGLMLLAGHAIWSDAWWAPFASMASIVLLFLVSHATLLDPRPRARWLRRSLLLLTLYFILDFSLNLNYTFESDLRDTVFGPLVWNTVLKALDIGLVYDLEDKPPPRWCVPDWRRCDPKRTSRSNLDGNQSRKLGKRPEWARQMPYYVPAYWALLDLPVTLLDRAIWTVDVTFLRRAGTSWLFPEEMRAMEWSKKTLEKAGQRKESENDRQAFGYSPATWKYAVLDTFMFLWAMVYLSFSHFPGSSYADFFVLPFWTRIRITSAVGIVIALPSTLGEKIILPLLQAWPLQLPPTALIPTFQDVGRSESLTDLWARRWHAMSKRDFVRVAKLLPFGRSQMATTLKVFFLSGAMHSLFFTHFKVRKMVEQGEQFTLANSISLYFASGPMLFFMLQGILVLLEQVLARIFRNSRIQTSNGMGIVRNIWVWGIMIYSGQWLSAELVRWNLLHHDQILAMRKSALVRDFGGFVHRHLGL
jgi:hypothetical protein